MSYLFGKVIILLMQGRRALSRLLAASVRKEAPLWVVFLFFIWRARTNKRERSLVVERLFSSGDV